MEDAFWDSSALVSLCVSQQTTAAVRALSTQFRMTVWWSTSVEMRSAFARLLRMGQITANGYVEAQVVLERMRSGWREVRPSDQVRDQAERLLDRFPLKAADAQQLAAAMTWCLGRPQGRVFLSGDGQLLEAAEQLGFQAIKA